MQRFLASHSGSVERVSIQRLEEKAPPTLWFGSTSPIVRTLQERLVSAGATIEVDGDFGPATLKAVKAVQSTAGLKSDGVVGPKTWNALDSGVQISETDTSPGSGYQALLAEIKIALQAIRKQPALETTAAEETSAEQEAQQAEEGAPTIYQGSTDEEEESSWLDELGGAAEEAWGGVTEAAEEAWGAVSETAEETWGAVTETAEETWGAVSETAEETWGTVTETAGEALGAAEEAWGQVESVASGIATDIEEFTEDLKERYSEEIAILKGIVSDLGRGLRLDDEQIAGLIETVKGLVSQLDPGAATTELGGETCKDPVQDFNATPSKGRPIDAKGLTELKEKVTGAGGGVGHLSFPNGISVKHTCLEPGPEKGGDRKVGAVKITAPAVMNIPVRGNVTTVTPQPEREEQGIKDFFRLIGEHEASHGDIHTKAMSRAVQELKGIRLGDLRSEFERIKCDSFGSQDSLDEAEGCVVVVNEKDAEKAKGAVCGNPGRASESCSKK